MKNLLVTLIIVTLIFTAGCSTSVKDINDNPDDYIDEPVVITGKAIAPIKIGSLEGFTLQDDDSSILISSDKLPKHGDSVTIKGTVKKSSIIGMYIKADKIGIDDD